MTECDKIQEILPAYLEGLASPPESEMVASHLMSCQECSLTVKTLMKSQKLIANMEEMDPPPWLKTRIMARIEEGVWEEEKEKWNLGRLRDLLFYPLRVKIPLQAFSVLLVAVVVAYVYRTIQPEVRPTQQAPRAVAIAPLEKEYSAPKAERQHKIEERTVRGEQPQGPTKTGNEDVGKPAVGIDGLLRSSGPQPSSSPPVLKLPQPLKEDAPLAAPEPEGRKTRSAKAFVPSAPSAPAPSENRAHVDQKAFGEKKAEADKGSIASPIRPEMLTLSVQVNDIKAGSNSVEAVLRDLNAPVSRESREGSSVISTEVPLQKAKEIISRLNSVGQVRQKGQISETPTDRTVSLKIQVLQKQP